MPGDYCSREFIIFINKEEDAIANISASCPAVLFIITYSVRFVATLSYTSTKDKKASYSTSNLTMWPKQNLSCNVLLPSHCQHLS